MVRLWTRTLGGHIPEEYPWTARVTANAFPRFVPFSDIRDFAKKRKEAAQAAKTTG